MENIVINFTSDPSGLQPGIDGLVQLGVVDKANADQAKKTMDTYAARDKTISSGASQSATQVDKLANSFKNLDKNIVGGAYSKSLQDLRTQVSKTGDEYKQLALVIDFAKKRMQDLNPNSPEWAELNKQVAAGEQLLKVYGEQAEVTGGKTNTLRTQLQQLKNEMSVLEEQGLGNSKQFEDVAVKAAKVEQQIQKTNTRVQALASEHANLDAFVGSVRGMTAAFEVAAGAEALLGNKNEDFEKALVRLNALMAISNGLREITEVLKEQSIVRIKAEAIGNALNAYSISLNSAAESKNIAVRYSAIAAQKILNAVTSASPFGIVLTILGGVAAALAIFSSSTSKATEEQIKLNAQLKIELDYLDQLDKDLRKPYDERIDRAKDELEVMQAGRTERDKILAKEKEIADLEVDRANFSKGFLGDQVNDLGQVTAELENQRVKLKDLKQEAEETRRQGGFFQGLFTDDRNKSTIEEDIKKVEGTIANLEKKKENAERINKEISDTNTKQSAADAAIQKKAFDDGVKSYTAYAEARVLIAKKGSQEELTAQINGIKAREAAELANVDLLPNERRKITSDSIRQEAELLFNFDQKRREETIKAIDARAALEKEGSRKRLDLELTSLDLQKDKELQTGITTSRGLVELKEITEEQKSEINDRFLKDSSDKVKEFANRDSSSEVSARISKINAEIAKLSLSVDADTNSQLLENKKNLIDEQSLLEIISINDTVHNEEERRAKVQEVYAKALADKKALERAKNKAAIDEDLGISTGVYDNEIAKQKLILDNDKSSIGERKAARESLFKFTIDKINQEQDANYQLFLNGSQSFEAYLNKNEALEIDKQQAELNREKEVQAQKIQIISAAFGILAQLSDAYFTNQQQQRQADLDQQLSSIQKAKEFELSNKTLTEDQKAQIDKKYAEKEKQLKIAAFNADKDAKKQQAIINGFLAVTNALATVQPFIPAALIAAGVAAVSAGIQVTAISNTRPPAFAKGTRKAPAGFKWVGEEGPELTYDKGGYAIITHEESKRLAAKNYHDWAIMQKYDLPVAKAFSALSPHYTDEMTTAIENHYITNHSGGTEIDYDRLGKAVARHVGNIENIPQTKLSIDENGFNVSVQKGLDEIAYVNKKLNL